MLKKRLWTALLALAAVAMTAGGALANPGDITLKFSFAPMEEIIRDFRYSRQGEVSDNSAVIRDLPNGVEVVSDPVAKTVTFKWPENFVFDAIEMTNGTTFMNGAFRSLKNAVDSHNPILSKLTVQDLYDVCFTAGNIVASVTTDTDLNPNEVSITGIEVSGQDDGTSLEGIFTWDADNSTFVKVAAPTADAPISGGHIVLPANQRAFGHTCFLIIKTSDTQGYYIPVLVDQVEEGGVNIEADEGVIVDRAPTDLTDTVADLGSATMSVPSGVPAAGNFQLYRPNTVDDRHYPIDDPASVTDLKPALMKTQVNLTLPKGSTTGTNLLLSSHMGEHAQPGKLFYFNASGVRQEVNLAVATDNLPDYYPEEMTIYRTAAPLTTGTYYLQIYNMTPSHYDPNNSYAFTVNPVYTLNTKVAYYIRINVQEDQSAAAITTPSADGTTATVNTPVSFAYTAKDKNGTDITDGSGVTISATMGSTTLTPTMGTGNTFTVTPTAAGTLSVTVTVTETGVSSAARTVTVEAATSGGESGSGTGGESGSGSGTGGESGSGTGTGGESGSGTGTGGESGSGTGTGGESGSGTGTGGESGGTPVTPTKTAVTLTPATGATAPTVKAGAETTVTFTVSPDVAGKAEVKVADTSIATATAAYRTVSTAAASGGTVSVAVKGVKAGMTTATLTFTPTDSTRYTAPAAVTLNITVTASGSSSEPDGPTSDKDSDTEKKAEAILENLDTSTPGGAAMAEKLSNPEDKAAAVDAVEALERAGTDVSTLSSKDVEALVQNKKDEEAAKEVEKSGSVSDPTVPAASELLDSATALSVSPKVVTPTPVTDEAVLADMKTGIENFTAEKDSGVDSSAVTAAKDGLQTADKIDIADAATSLTEQTKVVEDLFNMVSADLTKFGSNGVVIATVLPKMTPKASGFFPLSVNLRHLTPGRVLRFWLSPAAFTKKATGSVSVAEATEGQYFFLDENGVPTSVVTGDPAKMRLVVYLTAVQSASLAAGQPVEGAFITVDGTPDDKTTLEEMTKSDSSGEGGEGGGNSDGPTSNKGSGGCDALSGGLALLALIPLFMRKRS